MNPTITELEESGKFQKILEIKHDDIVPFIMKNMKANNFSMQFFYLSNLLIIAGGFYMFVTSYNENVFTWAGWLMNSVSGVLLFFLLVPLHEFLHIIAYRLMGAKHAGMHAHWDQFVFYALADKFVINRQQFYFLALLPFVVINGLLIILLIYFPYQIKWAFLSALFLHNTGCIGDFSMIGYFTKFSDKEVYTYDDKADKMSYFFVENE